MNLDKPLRRVSIFALVLILALMINVNYIQGSQAEKLKKDPLNARQYLDILNRDRGKIMAGGTELALSERTERSDQKYQRKYISPEIFAPVTGYFAASGGTTFVEHSANSLLDGTDDRLAVRRWFDQFVGKPVKGANVETTINPQAQRVAYNALKNSTNRRGAAVVMDVKTGAIVVMATYPSYDTNDVATNNTKRADQAFRRLAKADFQPMVNKAMNDTFPPGSSFKIVIAATALESGLNKESQVDTPSVYVLPGGHPLPNSHEGGACGAGAASLIAAFAESCNTTFAKLGAEQLGGSKVDAQAAKFGYGTKTEVETGVRSAASALPPDHDKGTVALASIGQGDNRATPLQMAMVAAAVANDGKIMKPYLVDKVRSADQSVLEEAEPQELAQPISADNAGQLQDMMRQVVTTGTANNLSGKNVAGKTGTAETGRGFNDRWFVGFSPFNNPRYAFAVVTEGPGAGATSAGELSATIMRAVLSK
ncbi:MAG TPA: penicillin-binding transpeptidase domain-containing protein [Streptosporangiaceae bacterium]|nr:penicillin-binding transpeptidase domain-containing protein [Streptosporangiaceae bacterium]